MVQLKFQQIATLESVTRIKYFSEDTTSSESEIIRRQHEIALVGENMVEVK